jgi:hypothetical protein
MTGILGSSKFSSEFRCSEASQRSPAWLRKHQRECVHTDVDLADRNSPRLCVRVGCSCNTTVICSGSNSSPVIRKEALNHCVSFIRPRKISVSRPPSLGIAEGGVQSRTQPHSRHFFACGVRSSFPQCWQGGPTSDKRCRKTSRASVAPVPVIFWHKEAASP